MAGGQRSWPHFMLRLSPEMKEWVAEQAERGFSSKNSVILACIQERMDRLAAMEARRRATTGRGSKAKSPVVA